jgi:putative membrane-bound dehydrogenase-like protein
VPPGFVVERVAGPPLVDYPMVACFDERGRLFVAHAAGRNVRGADELLKQLPNSIRLLEPADADGRFHKSTVFADKMTLPTGALWHDSAFYVCSPPYLWRMRDTHGTGRADVREKLVGTFEFWGHAGDIHGPFLGPDGRLYWTDGLVGHRIHRPDGTVLAGHASGVYRCRPDGSDVEMVCGGGNDNPVMMTFTAEGEPLATSTLLNNYPARYDGVIYAIDGGVYPHHAELIAELKQTGGVLPAVANLGHVSPSGITRYRDSAFGKEYEGNLFVTQYNTHKVQRLVLERDGATFRVRTEDFLVSPSEHFHPTYVLEDADGSLLVVDTGGWFTIGCHVSILNPEAKGGIYRIRRRGAPKVDDPRGLALAWERLAPAELARLLDDPRWAVRDRAVGMLVKHSDDALPALKQVLRTSPSVRTRRNAVWALTRMDIPAAQSVLRTGLDDRDASVRLSAARGVGLHRDAAALERLVGLLARDSPPIRREAATALGRIHKPAAVPALLDGLRDVQDRFLEHALIYALIQIDHRAATLTGLRDASPRVRRGALIALDQMDHGGLDQQTVAPVLETRDPALQQTALAVVSARGWARGVAEVLRHWLGRDGLSGDRREGLRSAVPALCGDQAVQELVTAALHDMHTPVANRLLLLEALADVPAERWPAAWVAQVSRCLHDTDAQIVRQAVAALRAAQVSGCDAALLRLARDEKESADVRVAALAAAAPRLPRLDAPLFAFLRGRLDPQAPPLARLQAAGALGNARLADGQLRALADVVARAGPLEAPHLLSAFERTKRADVGRRLVAALGRSPGLPSLAPAALRRALEGYPDEVREAARPLFKRLEVDADRQRARLAALEPVLSGGDPGHGRGVFFGAKAGCATCHTVQSQGGNVGPDLSKIGSVRSGHDLLEAVVFPSANFARGYEPFVVTTRSGKFHPGIIKRETADAIYLVTAERVEVRIARADIESIEPGKVSIMPQGLDTQLTRQELADMLAFLQSLR